MTKYFIVAIIFSCFSVEGQQFQPPFLNNKLVFVIPAFLPGVMDDSTALVRSDSLFYNVKGQLFEKEGYRITPNKKRNALETPWQTLFELINAYWNKDKQKIIDLYMNDSKEKVKSLLLGKRSQEFLTYVSKAAHSNLRILGGIQYKQGFMAYTIDDTFGVHTNYMVKEDGKYKLSALNDNSHTAWNIALYFKFNPKPIMPLSNLIIMDSLKLSDSAKVNIVLPEAGRWVALYFGNPGEPVPLLVQDNGINDLNPQPSHITFYIKGSMFLTEGGYTYYVSSFNYPVQRISKNFFIESAKYNIRIY